MDLLANLQDVDESIFSLELDINDVPDFDAMVKVADAIEAFRLRVEELEIRLSLRVSDIVKLMRSDESYFDGGKPPSMAFIEKAYLFTGIDGELVPVRRELAKYQTKLEKARLYNKIQRDQIDVFRTRSANERGTASF